MSDLQDHLKRIGERARADSQTQDIYRMKREIEILKRKVQDLEDKLEKFLNPTAR